MFEDTFLIPRDRIAAFLGCASEKLTINGRWMPFNKGTSLADFFKSVAPDEFVFGVNMALIPTTPLDPSTLTEKARRAMGLNETTEKHNGKEE